ncbi:MAG: HD domain-containing protein [Christensenellaceae bacterium]
MKNQGYMASDREGRRKRGKPHILKLSEIDLGQFDKPRQSEEELTYDSHRRSYVVAGLVYVLEYLLLAIITIGLIILGNPKGWFAYLQANVSLLSYLFVCMALLFVVVYGYYFTGHREALRSHRRTVAMFTCLDVCVILNCVAGFYAHIYARPVALMSLLVMLLFSKREATMWTFVFAILMFVIDTYMTFSLSEVSNTTMYSSLIISVTAGMAAIFLGSKCRTRFASVMLGLFLMIPIVGIILLLELTRVELMSTEMLYLVVYGCVGGTTSTVLFLVLLPIFEKVFNILTDFRLRELTSPDCKLIAKLKKEAPGTFNHSMVVAQIAEMCAASIDENVELARAAAFYHDMGKLGMPECFTENQKHDGTTRNIHDELAPELSAEIIRAHARDGYDLIMAHHLPSFFADVAIQHHGTLPIKVFYYKALKMTDGQVDIRDYSYPGPKPSTKIAAIIMIADASEAAARSLQDRSIDNVERVVRGIIEERVDLDQFTDCDITMKELETIKKTIVFSLTGVYHHRVDYPHIQFGREDRTGGKKA